MPGPRRAPALLLAAIGFALVPPGASPAAAADTTTAAPYGDCLVTVAGLDLQAATVPQLQAAMVSGRLTSRRLTQAYLAGSPPSTSAP